MAVILSKMDMKVFRTIGVFAISAALFAAPGWSAPVQSGQATPLTQPTPQQMRNLKKILSGQSPQTKPAANANTLLPAVFGGWIRGKVSTVQPEAVNASAFHEFGWVTARQADYSRDGDRLSVRVLKFQDATGAYGVFTMLRTPGMQAVRLGAERFAFFNGAIAPEHVLFWKGDLLVEARLAQPIVDEKQTVTSLNQSLPQTMGPRSVPPVLEDQLPRKGLDASSIQYAIGASAYQREGGALPPEVMDFDTDAEVVMAHYGGGILTIISYPTPEIAQVREAAIAGVLDSGGVPGPKDAQFVKRSGPLVAMTSGNFTAAQAKALLKQVQFQGTVAIDQLKPQKGVVEQTAEMLVGIAMLTLILGCAALVIGFLIGGGRAMYRVMRGKPASSMYDVEFIALDLDKPPSSGSEVLRDKRSREQG